MLDYRGETCKQKCEHTLPGLVELNQATTEMRIRCLIDSIYNYNLIQI